MKKLVLFAAFATVVGLSSCTNKAKENSVEQVKTEEVVPVDESNPVQQEEVLAEPVDTTVTETVTE